MPLKYIDDIIHVAQVTNTSAWYAHVHKLHTHCTVCIIGISIFHSNIFNGYNNYFTNIPVRLEYTIRFKHRNADYS